MSNKSLTARAEAVSEAAKRAGVKVALAESCTGGLVTKLLTDLPGSSAVVDCAFVTYSNEAKSELLGIDPALIERNGAVSEPVARAMAEGALARTHAAVTVGVTGIAGPTGGSKDKPVGLVHFGTAARAGETRAAHEVFDGDREAIRDAAAGYALDLILERLTALHG